MNVASGNGRSMSHKLLLAMTTVGYVIRCSSNCHSDLITHGHTQIHRAINNTQ